MSVRDQRAQGPRTEIKLYRNTHTPDQARPETEWEVRPLAPDQEQAWTQFGLIGHMLYHTEARTPQQTYQAVLDYEREFNPDGVEEPVEEVQPHIFLRGLSALIDASLVRAVTHVEEEN